MVSAYAQACDFRSSVAWALRHYLPSVPRIAQQPVDVQPRLVGKNAAACLQFS
jgi:hypothetical protein